LNNRIFEHSAFNRKLQNQNGGIPKIDIKISPFSANASPAGRVPSANRLASLEAALNDGSKVWVMISRRRSTNILDTPPGVGRPQGAVRLYQNTLGALQIPPDGLNIRRIGLETDDRIMRQSSPPYQKLKVSGFGCQVSELKKLSTLNSENFFANLQSIDNRWWPYRFNRG
jgi:hypothetical protein